MGFAIITIRLWDNYESGTFFRSGSVYKHKTQKIKGIYLFGFIPLKKEVLETIYSK